MTSEADRILAESRRTISLARRTGAVVYGLALTVGVVLVLRAELAEKFDMALLFSTDTRGAVYSLSYSLDKGEHWTRLEEKSPGSGVFALTPPPDYRDPIPVRVSPEIPDSVLDTELASGRLLRPKDAPADEKKARSELKDILLRPVRGIPCPVTFSIDGGLTWRGTAKEAIEQRIYTFTHAPEAGLEILLRARPASSNAVLGVWAAVLILTVPVGLAIAWVVLRLGYFTDGFSIATLVFFTVFGLTMIVPFIWMISTAFKTQQEATLFKIQWLPWPIRWANFADVFRTVQFGRFYINSVFLASYATIGLMFTSSLAAYSFARLDFPGRDKLFLAYLGTMMIPGAVTSIPVFVLMCKIGWVDSYKAIIVPGLFSAYGTFMLRQFFMTLPRDLEDAAKIDGCSLFGIFVRIILPLSKPAIATLTIFTFMGSWGDFMWPLIILNDTKKMPLPVGIQFFAASEYPDPNVLMAATMMMIVPVIIVFILGQRYFVEGIQLGAVKG